MSADHMRQRYTRWTVAEHSSDVMARTVTPARWIDRKFSFDLPVSAFPDIVQRLESMPDRARTICKSATDWELSFKPGRRWSAKEHIGHLDDLSAVDEKRLKDYLSNASSLSSADVTNPITEAANHNAKSWIEIIEKTKQNRLHFTRQIAQLTPADLIRTARHLRLQQQMRLLDWLWFIAEHDDHHLAAASAAISVAKAENSGGSAI
jgi:uncharacterized damage-inducible protein DinB